MFEGVVIYFASKGNWLTETPPFDKKVYGDVRSVCWGAVIRYSIKLLSSVDLRTYFH